MICRAKAGTGWYFDLDILKRDLMIRQRQRQWKRRWKIDFVSFQTFSLLCQVTQLFQRREIRLELKRRDRVRLQTEIGKIIALSFSFSRKLKIGLFHV